MKQYLTMLGISICVCVISIYVFYNFTPVEPISLIDGGFFDKNLGTTITTIQSTDKISDSRAVINTNFANLNSSKMEISTTTLPKITTLTGLATVGTITTGTWNADVLTATYGGTGSSTLSSNQVLLGNGTGILKTVSGFGSSGQYLVSNGAGSAPSWQTSSVNQSDNYTWTGEHAWSASSSFSILQLASSTFGAYPTLPTSDPTTSRQPTPKSYVDAKDDYSFGDNAWPPNAGTQVIPHGLSSTPGHIKISAVSYSNVAAWQMAESVGIYDGTTHTVLYHGGQAAATTSTEIIYIQDGTNVMKASAAIDDTNITLTWSETNNWATTIRFQWEAFGN